MSVFALASLLTTQAPVTLLYQPKVGSSYRFAISSSIKTDNGATSVAANSLVKVLSHTGSYYRVETTVLNMKSGGKVATPSISQKPTVLDYDKYGAVKLDQKYAGPQQLMGSFSSQALGMQFPRKPVKVGDTWTNSVDLGAVFSALLKGGSTASGSAKLTFKLVQLTTKAAVVSCALKGSVSMNIVNRIKGRPEQNVQTSLSLTGNGQYTVERSSGVYLASNMSMAIGTASAGRHSASTQTVSMKRL